MAEALDERLPARVVDRNLLIGTWNIRRFGNITMKWEAGDDDSPKRDMASLLHIKEIVSRFDVIALQEVTGNLRGLRHMLKMLGPHWGLFLTDATEGALGAGERMAFLFDMRRVKPSGLACELVVPEVMSHGDAPPPANFFQRQFARTPYAAAFRAGDHTFILCTFHIHFGADSDERVPELKATARWLRAWADRENSWDHTLIALGDFNIDRTGDELYQAFTSTGLSTHEAHHATPRTVFSRPGEPDTEKHYDQIAWFVDGQGEPVLTMKPTAAGHFDFRGLALADLTVKSMSYRISDHFPLWTEFDARPLRE